MNMIDILKKSIKSERTGHFQLHIQSLKEMLPFLAASGHNNYTKSRWLYLQQMINLNETYPTVYDLFCQGHHVVRRNDSFWAGVSTDLAIEQVLMKSLKVARVSLVARLSMRRNVLSGCSLCLHVQKLTMPCSLSPM